MKKMLPLALALSLIISMLGLPVYADDSSGVYSEVIEFDGGYYCVKTVYELSNSSTYTTSNAKTKSGYATIEMFNNSNDLVATLTVYGTFTYDGRTATATHASCDYNISMNGWNCTSADSYCSGDTAYAKATFEKLLLRDINATVTLTCSPSGVLS